MLTNLEMILGINYIDIQEGKAPWLIFIFLAAGKVTVGLASHWPCVTDISGSPPIGSRHWRGDEHLPTLC